MKYVSYWFFFILVFSCNAQEAIQQLCEDPIFNEEVHSYINYTVPVMSVETLASSKNEYVVIDVRDKKEYAISHIEGAKHIDWTKIKKKELAIAKDTKVVLYCSIGYRSEKAGETLQKMGYTQVYNLYGSIFEWANQGFPIVNEEGKETKKIHTYNKKWSKWVLEDSYDKVW